ncbi:MAG: acylphosphatase [Parabacteroides merdae]
MKERRVVISVLTIQGLAGAVVQSVGFRPFIYRIASEMNICGESGPPE